MAAPRPAKLRATRAYVEPHRGRLRVQIYRQYGDRWDRVAVSFAADMAEVAATMPTGCVIVEGAPDAEVGA